MMMMFITSFNLVDGFRLSFACLRVVTPTRRKNWTIRKNGTDPSFSFDPFLHFLRQCASKGSLSLRNGFCPYYTLIKFSKHDYGPTVRPLLDLRPFPALSAHVLPTYGMRARRPLPASARTILLYPVSYTHLTLPTILRV